MGIVIAGDRQGKRFEVSGVARPHGCNSHALDRRIQKGPDDAQNGEAEEPFFADSNSHVRPLRTQNHAHQTNLVCCCAAQLTCRPGSRVETKSPQPPGRIGHANVHADRTSLRNP